MTLVGQKNELICTAQTVNHTSLGLRANCSSAFSNFVTLSAMFAWRASAICPQERENICAANLATFAGLIMQALEEPGGFVRQVSLMPSGGQETTGKFAR